MKEKYLEHMKECLVILHRLQGDERYTRTGPGHDTLQNGTSPSSLHAGGARQMSRVYPNGRNFSFSSVCSQRKALRGETVYPCTVCGTNCDVASDLQRHLPSKAGEDRLASKLRMESLKRKTHSETHSQHVSKLRILHVCQKCHCFFKSHDELEEHEMTEHAETHKQKGISSSVAEGNSLEKPCSSVDAHRTPANVKEPCTFLETSCSLIMSRSSALQPFVKLERLSSCEGWRIREAASSTAAPTVSERPPHSSKGRRECEPTSSKTSSAADVKSPCSATDEREREPPSYKAIPTASVKPPHSPRGGLEREPTSSFATPASVQSRHSSRGGCERESASHAALSPSSNESSRSYSVGEIRRQSSRTVSSSVRKVCICSCHDGRDHDSLSHTTPSIPVGDESCAFGNENVQKGSSLTTITPSGGRKLRNGTAFGKSSSEDNEKIQKYKCPFCPKLFTKRQNMLWHRERHDIRKIFPCPVCKSSFDSVARLQQHLQSHAGDKLLSSQFCVKGSSGKSYIVVRGQQNDLRMTKRARTSGKAVIQSVCPICSEWFPSTEELRRHVRLTHKATSTPRVKKIRQECPYCGEKFGYLYQLVAHQKKKHPGHRFFSHDRKHSEEVQESVIDLPIEENVMSVVSNSGKFQCSLCGKEVGSLFSMRRHREQHMKRKKYECSFCSQSFSYVDDLRLHQKCHPRKFTCPLCQISFQSVTRLQEHVRITHTASKTYSDGVFEDVSHSQRNNIAETESQELERHECPTCGECFDTLQELKNHHDSKCSWDEMSLLESRGISTLGDAAFLVKTELACDDEVDHSPQANLECWTFQLDGDTPSSESMQKPDESIQEWILPDGIP